MIRWSHVTPRIVRVAIANERASKKAPDADLQAMVKWIPALK